MEYNYIEINVSNILRDMNILVDKVMKDFIAGMLINEKAGFPQKDGTFVLYKARLEHLQDIVEKNFTQLPEDYVQHINQASMLILKHLLEQYVEKEELPKGRAAKVLKKTT